MMRKDWLRTRKNSDLNDKCDVSILLYIIFCCCCCSVLRNNGWIDFEKVSDFHRNQLFSLTWKLCVGFQLCSLCGSYFLFYLLLLLSIFRLSRSVSSCLSMSFYFHSSASLNDSTQPLIFFTPTETHININKLDKIAIKLWLSLSSTSIRWNGSSVTRAKIRTLFAFINLKKKKKKTVFKQHKQMSKYHTQELSKVNYQFWKTTVLTAFSCIKSLH